MGSGGLPASAQDIHNLTQALTNLTGATQQQHNSISQRLFQYGGPQINQIPEFQRFQSYVNSVSNPFASIEQAAQQNLMFGMQRRYARQAGFSGFESDTQSQFNDRFRYIGGEISFDSSGRINTNESIQNPFLRNEEKMGFFNTASRFAGLSTRATNLGNIFSEANQSAATATMLRINTESYQQALDVFGRAGQVGSGGGFKMDQKEFAETIAFALERGKLMDRLDETIRTMSGLTSQVVARGGAAADPQQMIGMLARLNIGAGIDRRLQEQAPNIMAGIDRTLQGSQNNGLMFLSYQSSIPGTMNKDFLQQQMEYTELLQSGDIETKSKVFLEAFRKAGGTNVVGRNKNGSLNPIGNFEGLDAKDRVAMSILSNETGLNTSQIQQYVRVAQMLSQSPDQGGLSTEQKNIINLTKSETDKLAVARIFGTSNAEGLNKLISEFESGNEKLQSSAELQNIKSNIGKSDFAKIQTELAELFTNQSFIEKFGGKKGSITQISDSSTVLTEQLEKISTASVKTAENSITTVERLTEVSLKLGQFAAMFGGVGSAVVNTGLSAIGSIATGSLLQTGWQAARGGALSPVGGSAALPSGYAAPAAGGLMAAVPAAIALGAAAAVDVGLAVWANIIEGEIADFDKKDVEEVNDFMNKYVKQHPKASPQEIRDQRDAFIQLIKNRRTATEKGREEAGPGKSNLTAGLAIAGGVVVGLGLAATAPLWAAPLAIGAVGVTAISAIAGGAAAYNIIKVREGQGAQDAQSQFGTTLNAADNTPLTGNDESGRDVTYVTYGSDGKAMVVNPKGQVVKDSAGQPLEWNPSMSPAKRFEPGGKGGGLSPASFLSSVSSPSSQTLNVDKLIVRELILQGSSGVGAPSTLTSAADLAAGVAGSGTSGYGASGSSGVGPKLPTNVVRMGANPASGGVSVASGGGNRNLSVDMSKHDFLSATTQAVVMTDDLWSSRGEAGKTEFIHGSIDMSTNPGAIIHSLTKGVVEESRTAGADEGWGETVLVRILDAKGEKTPYTVRYSHMQAGTRTVQVGETIDPGAGLGKLGSTGNSTGPHVDLQLLTDNATMHDDKLHHDRKMMLDAAYVFQRPLGMNVNNMSFRPGASAEEIKKAQEQTQALMNILYPKGGGYSDGSGSNGASGGGTSKVEVVLNVNADEQGFLKLIAKATGGEVVDNGEGKFIIRTSVVH